MVSATDTTADHAGHCDRLLRRSCKAHAGHAPVPSLGLVRFVSRLRGRVSAQGMFAREGMCPRAMQS
jgi:hypothetical protein